MKRPLPALRKARTLLAILPLACVLAVEHVHGCAVPVFYFALFEWQSNPHALALGALPKGITTASIKDQLDRCGDNLALDTTSAPIADGHVQIRFPKTNRLWWDAPLPGNDPSKGLDLLLNSPARQKIVLQLESGVSVVWVFLDSGDKKADDAAFTLPTDRLKYLQKVIDLPPGNNGNDIEEGPDLRNTPVPLKIAFTALRVSRDDPKEVGFVAQLLNVVPDLQAVRSPIIYPVFGRALLLAPLFGKNLNEAHIDNWTQFAVGACSCQVKELNPGYDLLVSADWDKFLGAVRTP
jgi:hypothetical protein